MKSRELAALLKPCLPLPGILAFDYDPGLEHQFLLQLDTMGWQSITLAEIVEIIVIGALTKACINKGWWSSLSITRRRQYEVNIGSTHGPEIQQTSDTALEAWCLAYQKMQQAASEYNALPEEHRVWRPNIVFSRPPLGEQQ